jgi:hypothetical protein
MAADFLTINYNAGGTPIISLYRPTDSFIPVAFWGNSFGSLDTGTSDANVAFNRVIKFFGQSGTTVYPFSPAAAVFEVFYAVAGDQVYRTFDYGATWSSVYTLSPLTANTINKSGLNIVYLNGAPALCIFWYNSPTARWYGAYTLDGVSWTTHGPFTLTAATTNGLTSDTVYNNSVYCTTGPSSNGHVVSYSPGAGFMTSATLSGPNGTGCACLAEYNNRLFCLFTRSAGTDSQLAEIVSSGAQAVTTSIHGSGNAAVGNMCALFADQNVGNLYGIFHGPTGFVAYEWTSSLGTPTNITSSVLESNLSTQAAAARLLAMVDEVEISGYPRIYLWFAPSGNAAATWTPFEWRGPNNFVTAIAGSSMGTAGSAMPANRTATGSYFWYPYSPYSVITSRTYVSGTIQLALRLYGSSTNNNTFRAFFATNEEEYPTRPCTLSSPNSGTVVGGNIVRNIIPGTPSGTYFTVTWDATTDGLANGAPFKLLCENFLL